jgi:hypothetical protein
MKNILAITLLTFLLLVPSFAQTPSRKVAEPKKKVEPAKIVEPKKVVEPAKAIEPAKVVEPEKVVEPKKAVEVKYDKFKDTTSVTLTLQLIKKVALLSTGEDLSLSLVSSFDGKKPTLMPDDINGFFLSVSKKKQYSNSHSWIVLADDERIRLGDGVYKGEEGAVRAAEVIIYSISLANLKKIASAKKVETQIGNAEFTLTEPQLQSLKDFYKQIIP